MKGSHNLSTLYTCTSCEVKFTSTTVKNHKTKFCSKVCRDTYSFRTELCKTCKEPFLVRKGKKNANFFCTKECYRSWQKEYVKPPQTENRKLRANSPTAIEKRQKTWEASGRYFNFKENKDWKRFYKKCDYLTRRLRKTMLETWDGYDYYTGEYIKDNQALEPQHKEYPTLDHKHSRSRAFKDGMTPQEITVEENLVWTTRSNNSKKGNREY